MTMMKSIIVLGLVLVAIMMTMASSSVHAYDVTNPRPSKAELRAELLKPVPSLEQQLEKDGISFDNTGFGLEAAAVSPSQQQPPRFQEANDEWAKSVATKGDSSNISEEFRRRHHLNKRKNDKSKASKDFNDQHDFSAMNSKKKKKITPITNKLKKSPLPPVKLPTKKAPAVQKKLSIKSKSSPPPSSSSTKPKATNSVVKLSGGKWCGKTVTRKSITQIVWDTPINHSTGADMVPKSSTGGVKFTKRQKLPKSPKKRRLMGAPVTNRFTFTVISSGSFTLQKMFRGKRKGLCTIKVVLTGGAKKASGGSKKASTPSLDAMVSDKRYADWFKLDRTIVANTANLPGLQLILPIIAQAKKSIYSPSTTTVKKTTPPSPPAAPKKK